MDPILEYMRGIRIRLLQEAFNCFQQVSQWMPWSPDRVHKYTSQAEVLVEFLEVEDCGSVGGFDGNNPVRDSTTDRLYNRFLAVLDKYDDRENIKPECGFTPESLGYYFTRIGNERHEVLNEYAVPDEYDEDEDED